MNYDSTNEMFRLVAELVNQSSRNIFLTGKAGTGKTTFLKYIRDNSTKQIAVVAPTGVAAINAGGVTIHSFFQLPLSPFIPQAKGFSGNKDETINPHSLLGRLRMTNEKKKVLQELELLIIDEVSMVRCDTMDAIDTVLRHIRHKQNQRFGGVQVLFIGDMFQLPPVIKEREWKLLSEYYSKPYFFESKVIKEEPPVYIEFNKIYRQSEEQFIRLLNQVRNNELNEEGIKILDQRFNPLFRREKQDGYIVLTTHNDKARDINAIELQKLKSDLFSFKAEISGEFYDNAYPAEEILQLKIGSQVMFIKNDADKSKRYFNGKIGIVTKVEDDKIFVQCKDEPGEIEVKKEKWENIRYTLDKTTRRLNEDVLGSFIQYPLRLAWAITIHKSQGLTFEKAIVDAGEAFAPGQVYVALSRCTNLSGMILQSRIRPSGLYSDNRIIEFSKGIKSANQLKGELAQSKKKYQLTTLISTFDFTSVVIEMNEILAYIKEHASSFNSETFPWIEELLSKINKLQETAAKFHLKLQSLFLQTELPEENATLRERIGAAANYFGAELQTLLRFIQRSPAVSDSRLHAKEYNESIKEIFALLSFKRFLLESNNDQINMEVFHRRKKEFILPPFIINAYAVSSQHETESPHPSLHQQLRKLRNDICSKKGIPIYMVVGSKAIDEMAEYLPQTLEELMQINGFGKIKVDSYGQQFLELIQQYSKGYNLISRIIDKKPKRRKKEKSGSQESRSDTRTETYKLYRRGMSVNDIAKSRNLTAQTIEGHLAYHVQKGEINIEELISPEKLLIIEAALTDFKGGSIIPIKEKLGGDISFGEIILAIAWSQFRSTIKS